MFVGPGGYVAAIKAAQLGLKVRVVLVQRVSRLEDMLFVGLERVFWGGVWGGGNEAAVSSVMQVSLDLLVKSEDAARAGLLLRFSALIQSIQ